MAVTSASYLGDDDGDGDDGEWEICNDDGFVYKRRRRRRLLLRPSAAADDDPRPLPPRPPGDAEAELRRRRKARRRLCLLGLRDKYRNELDQWESLASALLRLSSSAAPPSPSPLPPPPPPPEAAEEAGARRLLVDDLLSQVEAQEAILRKLSEVCDYAESLCKKREESLAESLIELPIWGSPHSLMASLSD
uniref:Uncharacterized protein n=1 Tax=Ananas comosus var. bracteatus TaxID=296719 RepID=A0A6V7NNE4_ANACO|nr:unnamed protein product [Ananas comosus var. bracteatus]